MRGIPVRPWSLVLLMLACAAFASACGSSGGDAQPETPASSDATAPAGEYDAVFAPAVAGYRAYLEQQTAQLVEATQSLRDAIEAGDLDAAKAAYVDARAPYRRISSIAAYLPAARRMDPQFLSIPIDATIGLHRVGFVLWPGNTTDGLLETADQLVADAQSLHDELPAFRMDALRMTEAYEPLESHPVITNFDPEPFSDLSLVVHEAHVDGAKMVFDLLQPAIAAAEPDLAANIAAQFDVVYAALEPFRRGDTFVLDAELSDADRQSLNQEVAALGSMLTTVHAVLQAHGAADSRCYGGDVAQGCDGS